MPPESFQPTTVSDSQEQVCSNKLSFSVCFTLGSGYGHMTTHLAGGCGFVSRSGNGTTGHGIMHGILAGHMTLAVTARRGAVVTLAGLHQRERDTLATLLAGRVQGALSDGGGAGGGLCRCACECGCECMCGCERGCGCMCGCERGCECMCGSVVCMCVRVWGV